jgi:putative OPT family oligopeptide transporter
VVLNLLAHAYGIGAPDATHLRPLLAPQATMMAAVSRGLFGGSLPVNMIEIGAVIGLAVIIFDEWLRARGAPFRAPVLAVAVGIYLPLELSVPIFVGGLLSYLARRRRHAGGDESLAGRGMLFAAGMIAGESLTGVLLAIPIVASGRADVLALPAALQFGNGVGLTSYLALACLLYWIASRREAQA